MMFPAASALHYPTLTVATSKIRLHYSFPIDVHRHSVSCSAKFLWMEHFNEPTKLVVFMNNAKEKLWKFIPGSVKQFPWKKAESAAQHEFLILGKETLKWSLVAFFACSCVSDTIYSISRNRELVIPLGLFVGILVTKFLNEISLELMHEQNGGIKRLLGISCFFVLVRVMSMYVLEEMIFSCMLQMGD